MLRLLLMMQLCIDAVSITDYRSLHCDGLLLRTVCVTLIDMAKLAR
jgi:hypothetical protein